MLDPNLNIWALLLYVYVLYGTGYVLGFAQDVDEDDRPGPIMLCFTILCLIVVWPLVKGVVNGQEDGRIK